MNEPALFKEPTLKRFKEEEIKDICRFVLEQSVEERSEVTRLLNEIIQEARRYAIYPHSNVFGDPLCKICRIRYHQEHYSMCSECAMKLRVERAGL